MLASTHSILEQLFHAEQPCGRKVKFRWRLISREGRPLLLLPENGADSQTSLKLYSAHRRRAKVWKALMPAVLSSPTRTLFPLIDFEADAAGEFLRFLAERAGVAPEHLTAPGVKFGGLGDQKSRLALLVCDQTNRPAKVVKVGFNGAGRTATEYEVSMMKRLPADVIGCVRLDAQISSKNWAAFATAFFPGTSPENDAGMELLFNSWLNPAEMALPLEEFESWRELEQKIPPAFHVRLKLIAGATQGKKFRSTLYHGDFAPWNLRAINALNLQAYDWEFARPQGIPGWDWFHFIVQTSILVKRHSPERVAAELEALIQSPRFQDYARRAGMEDCIMPLLLGFLLHHQFVVCPLHGGETYHRLFDLLWAHWHSFPQALQAAKDGATNQVENKSTGALVQIRSALGGLMNLFWHPTLTHVGDPTRMEDLKRHWKPLVASLVWIGVVAHLPIATNPHLMFAPFYLVPCIYMALNTSYWMSSLVALVSGFGGPLLFYCWNQTFAPLHVLLWNGFMRYLVFQIIVALFNRLRQHSVLRFAGGRQTKKNPLADLAGNWAVVLFAISILLSVVVIDYSSGVNALMTGLYIIPCMLLTLALDWRWGTVMAIACAVIGPAMQLSDPGYRPPQIMFWNFFMRMLMYEMVVLMIERVRRENILFAKRHEP